MTASPTVQNRLHERFDLWDVDGNGLLDRNDFEKEASRVLNAFGEPQGSPKGRAVVNSYIGLWNHLAQQADSDQLSREEFDRIGADVIGRGAAGWAAVVKPHISAIAELCDTDGDGKVSQAEFTKWLQAVGSQGNPAEAFTSIDKDNDGYLTIDELNTAVEAYGEGKLDVSLLG